VNRLEEGRKLDLDGASSPRGRATFGECPRFRTYDLVVVSISFNDDDYWRRTYLAFAVRPEVCNHADNVVESRVRALVYEEGRESAKRVDDEACFNRPVETCAGDEGEWPFV